MSVTEVDKRLEETIPVVRRFAGGEYEQPVRDFVQGYARFAARLNPSVPLASACAHATLADAAQLLQTIAECLPLWHEDARQRGERASAGEHLTRFLEHLGIDARRDQFLLGLAHQCFSEIACSYMGRFGMRVALLGDPVHAFHAARRVVESGAHDIGVVIGPEGFAVAPLFDRLRFPLVHVHIDEYSTTEDRPFRALDDLSPIAGKRTVLIEDDVRTGKTIARAVERLAVYRPAAVAVFLGLPERRQEVWNVPAGVQPVYVVPDVLPDRELGDAAERLLELLRAEFPVFRS